MDGPKDLLHYKDEMERKLRQNLANPMLRSALKSAIKERCCSVPSSPGRLDSRASGHEYTPQVEAAFSGRSVEVAASGRAVDRSRQLPTSSRFVQQQKRATKGVASRQTTARAGMRAQSVGALESPTKQPRQLATDRYHPVAASRPGRSPGRGKMVEVTVNSDPIPIRGRRNQGDRAHEGNSDAETNTISRAASAASLRAAETPETVTSTWESPGFAGHVNAFAMANGKGRAFDSHAADLTAEAGSRSGFDVQQQLQLHELDRLGLKIGLDRLGLNSGPAQTGGQPGAHNTPVHGARGSRAAEGSPLAERPLWLEGSTQTAMLEGQNKALQNLVAKSRQEIADLEKKKSQTEARMKALTEENQAAALALRQCAALSASDGRLPTLTATFNGIQLHPSRAATGQSPSTVDTTAAAVSLRNLVLLQPAATSTLATRPDVSAVASAAPAMAAGLVTSHWQLGLPGDTTAVAGEPERGLCRLLETSEDIDRRMEEIKERVQERQAKQARNRLLEASDDIDKRMGEILSRRGNLQAAIGSEVHAAGTGSSSMADEDSEGYHSSRNLAPLGVSSA